MSTNNLCFCGEMRKILIFFQLKKVPYLWLWKLAYYLSLYLLSQHCSVHDKRQIQIIILPIFFFTKTNSESLDLIRTSLSQFLIYEYHSCILFGDKYK